MSNKESITQVAIYPPIGIARIGNAPEAYFFAPEQPGQPALANGGYKDAQGRVKRQVARFRIYGLNQKGAVVRELTADDATIEWRVHVANHKAAWYQFNNALDLPGLAVPAAFRNSAVSDRAQLIIDPGVKRICGRDLSGPAYHLTGGKFFGKEVPLGEIRTDAAGRLLFFGGMGHSASYKGQAAITFANNDTWHDDVCDGTVRATVTLHGRVLEAEPAMVAVTPPNFGQGLYGVVTMYDVVYDLFLREGWLEGPTQLNFWQHIYPIFERMTQTQWVNSGFFFLFGQNSPSDLTNPDLVAQLSDPSPSRQPIRQQFLKWFRDPSSAQYEPAKIPPFYGDAFGEYENLAQVGLPVTFTQYQWLSHWAAGDFTTEKPTPPRPFATLSPGQQAEALTITPLEECLGGPFHPGIELTWPLRNLIMWAKPFRLKILPEGAAAPTDYGPLLAPHIALAPGGPLDGSGPGSLTRWLGVPWQTDEASCLSGYMPSTYLPLPSFWAARVPNQILSEDSFKRLTDPDLNIAQRLKHFDYRQDWLRDLGSQYTKKINNMIAEWHELGIITRINAPTNDDTAFLPTELWVESDRGPFLKVDPTFEQVKQAEHAAAEQIAFASTVLDEVSGKVSAERSQRERRQFGRDER